MEKSVEIVKIEAEIAKLMAETGKINAEARWYPIAMVTAMIGGIAAVIKLFG
jgi:hypothetical protein